MPRLVVPTNASSAHMVWGNTMPMGARLNFTITIIRRGLAYMSYRLAGAFWLVCLFHMLQPRSEALSNPVPCKRSPPSRWESKQRCLYQCSAAIFWFLFWSLHASRRIKAILSFFTVNRYKFARDMRMWYAFTGSTIVNIDAFILRLKKRRLRSRLRSAPLNSRFEWSSLYRLSATHPMDDDKTHRFTSAPHASLVLRHQWRRQLKNITK